jgi:hypothetical protein
MDENQIIQLFNEKLKQTYKQTYKQNRRKSYVRPRLSSINELLSTPVSNSYYDLDTCQKIKSNCEQCNFENEHIMKQFICKNCKSINF